MRRWKKTARGMMVGVTLTVAVTLAGVSSAAILEEIVARVNDSIITRSELEDRRVKTADRLRESMSGAELQKNLRLAQDRLLLDMINEDLLVQQAQLTFDMDKYYERLRHDFMRVNKISTDADLVKMLQQEGKSPEEFRRLLLRSNVPGDVIRFEVTRKISISPKEMKAYYDAHKDDFVVRGEVMLREIVILDADRGREAARALVDQIMARHAAGEEFEALARELSESPSREKGGLVGPYTSGELAPALEAEAFSLPIGGIGEPLDTSYGFQIIQLESRTPTRRLPLDEVHDQIEDAVRKEKFSLAFDAYMTGLWSQNKVVLNPRYATGLLEDGGPYATREELLPAANPMGPPPVSDGTKAER
ncbi:MAG: peptidyl-prolyl cis-trans isomerase [Acidobacteriota bacterium]